MQTWRLLFFLYGIWFINAINASNLLHYILCEILIEYQLGWILLLGERVKEHSKSTTSAILKHCKDFHHPLPSINDFNIIDKDPSQVTREAKEAIHIRRLDPSLNRNIGKMSIPHCFDNLLGAKPKNPRVGELSVEPSVEEVAPPTQIPGINLTQFNNIGNFRPNVAIHIPRHSTRACRARNLFNWAINWTRHNIAKLFNTWHELSSVIPSISPLTTNSHVHQVSELDCKSSPHLTSTVKDHWTACQRCKN